ncbi:MAG: AEC family transporter [Verrucomicrobiales bacterium]|nr:AEC family transporter [Verrucomicrobiales bacterium]
MLLFAEIFRDVCLPILLIMAIGWIMDRRFNLNLDALVKLNIYLFVPVFIFVKLAESDLAGGEAVLVVVFTLCIILAMGAGSWVICRLRGDGFSERTAMQLSTMFYNSGNWGIPLMTLAFTDLGPVVQVFVLATMNVTTFSIGLLLANSHLETEGPAWRKFLPMLRQPSIYAITAGLLVRHFEIPVENVAVIWGPLNSIAAGLVAFALLTLGVQLSKTKPPSIAGRVAWALGLRLLGGPALAIGLTKLFGFSGEIAAILIIGAASPTAVNTALIAHEFKADSRFAAAIVFYSTIIAGFVVAFLLFGLKSGWIPWAEMGEAVPVKIESTGLGR